jgi:hypothetical protein
MEPPGGESGNIERTWGMHNKPEAAVHPLSGPHTTTTTATGYILFIIYLRDMVCFSFLIVNTMHKGDK